MMFSKTNSYDKMNVQGYTAFSHSFVFLWKTVGRDLVLWCYNIYSLKGTILKVVLLFWLFWYNWMQTFQLEEKRLLFMHCMFLLPYAISYGHGRVLLLNSSGELRVLWWLNVQPDSTLSGYSLTCVDRTPTCLSNTSWHITAPWSLVYNQYCNESEHHHSFSHEMLTATLEPNWCVLMSLSLCQM